MSGYVDGLKGIQKAHGVYMDTATLFSLEELFCFVLLVFLFVCFACFFLNNVKIRELLNLTEASLVAQW